MMLDVAEMYSFLYTILIVFEVTVDIPVQPIKNNFRESPYDKRGWHGKSVSPS